MSDTIPLTAEVRARAGKGGARETRRAGRIPAIIYGNRQEPMMIAVDEAQLNLQLRKPGFMAHVFEIELAGRKERVLPRDVQNDPVSGRPLHVDFMRFSAETRVTVAVEVRFVNDDKAPGLRLGGVLNVVQHSIDLVCRPDAIPEAITVDLTGLQLGDVIHLDGVSLPADVELGESDPKATIASIAAPTSEVVAEAAEGEAEKA
jgi:large subunit ribosomal protein L25